MSDLDRTAEPSKVVTLWQRAVQRSRVASVLRNLGHGSLEFMETVEDWWRSSSLGRTVDTMGAVLGRSIEASTPAGVVATMERWSRGSFVYRWLTAEPDPDVIVIDLRETRSVGPVIKALDGGLDCLSNSRTGAGVYRLIDAARAAPIRVASVGLLIAVAVGLGLQVALGMVSQSGIVVTAVAATLGVVGFRTDTSWDELRETRTVEWLITVVEPPEPPEEFDRRDE